MDGVPEFLQALSVGDVGFAALVSLAIYLIYTGRLVPRSTVESLTTVHDKRVADKDDQIETWKAAYEKSEAARQEQGEQMRELLETSRVTRHFIQSLPNAPLRAEASMTSAGGA